MGLLADTVQVYEELRQHTYTVNAEGGLTFSFSFLPENYHHLAGFQHIEDVVGISNPKYGRAQFYRLVKNGLINDTVITSSQHYSKIADRLASFAEIKHILFESNEIIVNFDPALAQSDIVADFFLYKRDGDPIKGPFTYYHLFLGHDPVKGIYFPATYIVEPSKQYISGQEMLTCEIIIT